MLLFAVTFVAFGVAHGLIPIATILAADSTSFDDGALGSSIFLFCFDASHSTGPLILAAMMPLFGIGSSIGVSSAVFVWAISSILP